MKSLKNVVQAEIVVENKTRHNNSTLPTRRIILTLADRTADSIIYAYGHTDNIMTYYLTYYQD